MKYQKLINSFCTLCILLLFSCQKESNEISITSINRISKNYYYSSEIFTGQHIKLYGKWKFYYIFDNAGIAGGPGKIDPTYDFLEFKKHGIYGKVKEGKLVEVGKIEIVEQNYMNLLIKFVPEGDMIQESQYWNVYYAGLNSIELYDAHVGCGSYAHVYKKISN